MSADIIEFAKWGEPGNGAREALIEVFYGDVPLADGVLLKLAERGFVVVPIEEIIE